MGFVKAQIIADGIHAAEAPPPTATFTEPSYRRRSRQFLTLIRAVRADRARAQSDPWRHAALIDGARLRDLVATVAGRRRASPSPPVSR